ncbi:hypothetical protein CP556_15075 [Natrinema sp. CBA1119]|nr:hypothetical protein CP556_15075 [Natrinema sp. CBA1119]
MEWGSLEREINVWLPKREQRGRYARRRSAFWSWLEESDAAKPTIRRTTSVSASVDRSDPRWTV